jgi:hypothetical protein
VGSRRRANARRGLDDVRAERGVGFGLWRLAAAAVQIGTAYLLCPEARTRGAELPQYAAMGTIQRMPGTRYRVG